jgi:hypothetical protein
MALIASGMSAPNGHQTCSSLGAVFTRTRLNHRQVPRSDGYDLGAKLCCFYRARMRLRPTCNEDRCLFAQTSGYGWRSVRFIPEIFISPLPADRASDKGSGNKYKFRVQPVDISALQPMRAMDQGGQGHDQVDAAVMRNVRRQRSAAPASRALPTTSAIFCARWRRRNRSRVGR